MDGDTKEAICKVLSYQIQIAGFAKDALTRTSALRAALAEKDSTFGTRYSEQKDRNNRLGDSELIQILISDMQGLLDFLESEPRGKGGIQ